MLHALSGAATDIGNAIRLRRVWIALASEDITDAHRRTSLGPLWLVVNYLLFVAILVLIIRSAVGIHNYTVYVAAGTVVWFFIQETVNSGSNVFLQEESFIKGTTLPMMTYVMRQTMRSIIRCFYTLVGAAGIIAFSGLHPSPVWLTSIPALLLIFLTAPAVCIVFGIVGVVFPDSRLFIANVMRFGTFLTPIFWSHENAGGLRAALYYYNPFTHYLEIFRAPIYSDTVFPLSWIVCLTITTALWVVAVPLLGTYRRRIVLMI